jgi:hypothetical protein
MQKELENTSATLKAYQMRNKELAAKGLEYKRRYMEAQSRLSQPAVPDAEGWIEVKRKPSSKKNRQNPVHTQQHSEEHRHFHEEAKTYPTVHIPSDPHKRTGLVIPQKHRPVMPSDGKDTYYHVHDPKHVVHAGISKKYHSPNATTDLMVKEFNDYWMYTTGKNIHFKFYPENVSTLSLTEPSSTLNMFIRKFFYTKPVALVGFAGVGGDAITIMKDLNCRDVAMIQLLTDKPTPYDQRTFDTLKQNVDNFLEEFPVLTKDHVHYSQQSVKDFIENTSLTHVDLLSLDPPWILKGDQECTPKELIETLKRDVFDALGKWIVPRVVTIKTRFGWEDMNGVMDLMPGYKRVVTLRARPFQGIYYYHCLALDIPENAEVVFSDTWHKAYTRAQKRAPLPFPNDTTNRHSRANPRRYEEDPRFKKPAPKEEG